MDSVREVIPVNFFTLWMTVVNISLKESALSMLAKKGTDRNVGILKWKKGATDNHVIISTNLMTITTRSQMKVIM
jgi:hypothetical protein